MASANTVASREAAEVLARGGNAFDAAVTCALVLSVAEPHSSGIGGGGFLVYYQAKSGKVGALDFRERAPRAAKRNLYRIGGKLRPRRALDGALSAAVPGTVPGLYEMHRKLGSLPWTSLVAPAVRVARQGYVVERRTARALRRRAKVMRRYAATRAMFFPGGRTPKAGDRLRHPDLADTLEKIAREGPRALSRGPIAARIEQEMRRRGGVLDGRDLREYRTYWRRPVRFQYRGLEVVSMPPPSSGGVHVGQMLQMLSGDDLRKLDPAPRAHLLVEAMRRVFADRALHLGDPAFYPVPRRWLLSPAYALARRRSIDPHRATPSAKVAPGEAPAAKTRGNTTHLSIVDRQGNLVAITQSVNYSFGSGLVVPGTGILLNDTMDDFSLAPGKPNVYGLVGGEANAIAAGKTPLSSMTPTVVLRRGKPWLALGSPGGSTIITTVFQVLMARIALGKDLAAAVGAPRLHHQWRPDRILLERRIDRALAAALRSRGHHIRWRGPIGNVNAVEIAPDGSRRAVSDPRGDGASAGY